MTNKRYPKYNLQSGSAVIETLITLPLLLVLSLCIYDYGKYLETYWTLEHAAREGVINMARLGDMNKTAEYNLDVTKNQFQNCFSDWTDATPVCKHRIVQWIVRKVADSQERWDDPNDFAIYTDSDDWGSGEFVAVYIFAKYRPLIDIFNKLELDIQVYERSMLMRERP